MKKYLVLLFVCCPTICYSQTLVESINSSDPYFGTGSITSEIKQTLDKVAYELKINNTDVNNDGQLNCIDAAVLFYQYFPDKSKVCIIVNRHPTNGWHHLFNCVNINGVWETVEPQATWKGYSSYWMRDCWGNTYDETYNIDMTTKYIKYVM